MAHIPQRRKSDLTVRQAMGIGVIATLANEGPAPTLVEIGKALGIKKASVQTLVKVLTRKGYIAERKKGSYRTIRLTELASAVPMRSAAKRSHGGNHAAA